MAYDYIKGAYGRDFEPGQRVNFTEYKDGRGVVMEPEGDPQYVRVKFDNGTEGDCHPGSVQHITSERTVLAFGGEEFELS